MPFFRLEPHDQQRIRVASDILEAARVIDDPTSYPVLAGLLSNDIAHGWDLEPDDYLLYVPEGAAKPVGVLQLGLPRRDNLHLATVDVVVHPAHRDHDQIAPDHRRTMMAEAVRLARAAGRTVLWVWAPEEDGEARAFLTGSGFVEANRDARRHQVLAEVDHTEVDRLGTNARTAAADYELVRLRPPLDDDLLAELVEVTAAINDAPMGELTFEDEVFDQRRLSDHQEAGIRRGDRRYRIVARHRRSGEVGGHTEVALHPLQPELAHQADTAVARAHRGHRLGMLLKIDMMHWLSETEPQLTTIQTYNNAGNGFMIDVNEALGYRMSRVFTTYQRTLSASASG